MFSSVWNTFLCIVRRLNFYTGDEKREKKLFIFEKKEEKKYL